MPSLTDPVIGQEHIEKMEVDDRPGDNLACRQRPSSRWHGIGKEDDDLVLEPPIQPFFLMGFQGIPQRGE